MNYSGYIVVFDHRFTESVETYVCVSHQRNHVHLVPIERMAGACYRTWMYNLETDGSVVAAFLGTGTILSAIRKIGPVQIDSNLCWTESFKQHLQETLMRLHLAFKTSLGAQPIKLPGCKVGREVEVIGDTGFYDRWLVLSDDLNALKVTRSIGEGAIYDVDPSRWTVLADAPGLPSLERLIKRIKGPHPELESHFARWSTSAHFGRTVT